MSIDHMQHWEGTTLVFNHKQCMFTSIRHRQPFNTPGNAFGFCTSKFGLKHSFGLRTEQAVLFCMYAKLSRSCVRAHQQGVHIIPSSYSHSFLLYKRLPAGVYPSHGLVPAHPTLRIHSMQHNTYSPHARLDGTQVIIYMPQPQVNDPSATRDPFREPTAWVPCIPNRSEDPHESTQEPSEPRRG
jgi:hypothetical protein